MAKAKEKIYPVENILALPECFKTVPAREEKRYWSFNSAYGLRYKDHFARADCDTIVYKKVMVPSVDPEHFGPDAKGYKIATAKLLIPQGTLCYLTPYKCRAAGALVVSINPVGKGMRLEKAHAWRDTTFIYTVGSMVFPEKRFSMRNCDCESGIHFLRTLTEARSF